MEQQIQDLIASIKKEGIDSATNESKKILEEARRQADKIIAEAKAEKDKMIADAEKKIAVERQSSEAGIRQAARDVSLSLKKSIEEKFQAILAKSVSKAMDAELVKKVLAEVISAEFAGKDVTVEVPASELSLLTSQVAAEFAKELKGGVEFKGSSLSGGFRVSEKDGSAYIDLSDEECTKLLYPYLSSAVKEML
ncbi:MAG: hypothetical protein KBS81_04485 [Spirochaetales bacterium]|nr:hypothetical protein [Candidatus Physcosoma equi]